MPITSGCTALFGSLASWSRSAMRWKLYVWGSDRLERQTCIQWNLEQLTCTGTSEVSSSTSSMLPLSLNVISYSLSIRLEVIFVKICSWQDKVLLLPVLPVGCFHRAVCNVVNLNKCYQPIQLDWVGLRIIGVNLPSLCIIVELVTLGIKGSHLKFNNCDDPTNRQEIWHFLILPTKAWGRPRRLTLP